MVHSGMEEMGGTRRLVPAYNLSLLVEVLSEEKDLIERLLSRQRTAWSEFFARYQKVICAQVHRTSRRCSRRFNQADFEDVCAEVFSVLLANDMASLRAFRGTSTLATWLTVIARRICLRHIDRQPLEYASGSLAAACESESHPHDSADALGRMIRDEESEQLGLSLAQLRERDRELLALYFHERLSYQEISQRMGISMNSVGPKIHRAQQRLRKLMNQQ